MWLDHYIIYIEIFSTYILFAIYHDVRTGKRSYSFLPLPDLIVTSCPVIIGFVVLSPNSEVG